MKLFHHSSGMIVSFGFDMQARKPNPHLICWNDPADGAWECKAGNNAGWHALPPMWAASPEFVFEDREGRIVAYQPGSCLVMTFIGAPLVWMINRMTPDSFGTLSAAA